MDYLIEINNLTFKRGQRFIFDNVSLKIGAGELVAVMGPSGTGKTTLMQLITGQLRPDSGEIYVFGEPVHKLSLRALMALREKMSILFQTGALFSDLTVGDNIAFVLREKTRLPEELIQLLVAMKLQRVGLRGAANLRTAELSGGMARRVALARAITLDPELMIYDEPFTGQDPISLGMLVKLVRDLHDGLHMTSLIVSHDVAEVSQIADRILLFSNGRLLADGTPAALAASSEPEVKQFMHAWATAPSPCCGASATMAYSVCSCSAAVPFSGSGRC